MHEGCRDDPIISFRFGGRRECRWLLCRARSGRMSESESEGGDLCAGGVSCWS
jgi:hypothetical protein